MNDLTLNLHHTADLIPVHSVLGMASVRPWVTGPWWGDDEFTYNKGMQYSVYTFPLTRQGNWEIQLHSLAEVVSIITRNF